MSDYLWDNSSEPDAHVKRLEEALAPLRYQRQPLQLPAHITHKQHPHWLPLIAATVILTTLAGVWSGGLYRNFRQQKEETQSAAITIDASPNAQKQLPVERLAHERSVRQEIPRTNLDSSRHPVAHVSAYQRQATSRVLLRALNGRKVRTRRILVASEAPPVAPPLDKTRDGEIAKEQLLLALRITSRKLDLAQRRMQEADGQPPTHR